MRQINWILYLLKRNRFSPFKTLQCAMIFSYDECSIELRENYIPLNQVYLNVGAEFPELSRASTSIVTFPSGKKVPLQLLSQGTDLNFNDVFIRHVDVVYSL